MEKITRIYLVTNCYGDPNKVYIGKEKSHQNKWDKRINRHIKTFGKEIIFNYIDETKGWNKEQWKYLECFWIEQFRQWNFKLQNKNRGGGGVDFMNPKSKSQISQKLKGRKHSKETRTKMSISGKGKKKTEEHKIKIGESRKGKERPQYIKDKISKGNLGKLQTKESNIKRSEKVKGIPKPLGFGDKISKTTTGKPKPYNYTPVIQYNLKGEFIKEWDSMSMVKCKLNIRPQGISHCCRKSQKTCGGFVWEYKIKN